MERDYWQERWKQEETGFHQNEVNPYLRQYWQALHLATGSEVFVPLCGKSRDMLWLSEQGYAVLGVETSAVAVQAFFKENGYIPNQISSENFDRNDASGIRILCGDFFDLSKHDLAKTSAVYDRASLIALPPEMRERYVDHLLNILPPAAQILLITSTLSPTGNAGPSLCGFRGRSRSALPRAFTDSLLSQLDVLAHQPALPGTWPDPVQEKIFLLTPHR